MKLLPRCENDALRENKSVELKRIYVSRACQGRGIGRQLLRETIASGQTKYPRAVFVRVYIDNSSAIAIYVRERFEYHDTASMLIGSRQYMVQVMKRQ
jgi:ribosomal protein S18 acetylase RimI-like enzyme